MVRVPAILLLFTIYWHSSYAQATEWPSKKLTLQQLPKQVRFRGELVEAREWNDKLGTNILITSFVKPYTPQTFEENGDEQTAELHAFHFVKKDTTYKLLWSLSDAVKNCSFDITLEFFRGSLTITDLDKDEMAETKVQYSIVCRSDVSPAGMKLIMHEDSVKYALRGHRWLALGPDHAFDITEKNVNLETLPRPKEDWAQYTQLAGRYTSEKEFAKAPKEFLIFARRQWLKFAIESFE